jgi:hypothetical protein
MPTPKFKALYEIQETRFVHKEFHAIMEDGTLARLRWTPGVPGSGLGKYEVFAVAIEDHRPPPAAPSFEGIPPNPQRRE